MRRNKKTMMALLLIAALVLGIGYASLSENLLVTGNVSYSPAQAEDEFDADIYFSDATNNDYCKVNLSASVADGNKPDSAALYVGGANCALELATKDQKAIATFTITSEYEADVKVTPVIKAVPSDNEATAQNKAEAFARIQQFYDFKISGPVSGQDYAVIPAFDGIGEPGSVTFTYEISPKANMATEFTLADFIIEFKAEMVTAASLD